MAFQNFMSSAKLPNDVYQTIESESQGIFKDKGSRFLSYAFPVIDEEEVKQILLKIRKEHHSARHCCYAWRIGSDNIQTRVNDDGEPSSTAGKPILSQITSYNLTNTMVVVVRYFGGILLGTGGLINAYKTAAGDALANAKIIQKLIEAKLVISFSYKELADVMNLVKHENLNLIKTVFEESCMVECIVRKSETDRIKYSFANIYGVTLKIDNA